MIELIIILIVVIALIAVGYVSFNLLKDNINEKASITTLKNVVIDTNKNDSSLRDTQIKFENDLLSNKSNVDNMFLNVNSNLLKNNKTIDIMNSSILELKNIDLSTNKSLSNININYNAFSSNYTKFSSNVNTDITNIKDTYVSKNFLMTDFASVKDNNLTIGPKGYKEISIVGKPLRLDSINMTNWNIQPNNDKLCFKNKNINVMCIASNPNVIEIYNSDGSITKLPTIGSSNLPKIV